MFSGLFRILCLIFFLASCLDSGKATEKSKQKNKNPDPRLPVGVLLTVATRNDVILYSVDINTRVESLGMFFSFTKRE